MYMGVSINGGTPIAGWFIMEHPIKWIISGYPHFRKPPHICNKFINLRIQMGFSRING